MSTCVPFSLLSEDQSSDEDFPPVKKQRTDNNIKRVCSTIRSRLNWIIDLAMKDEDKQNLIARLDVPEIKVDEDHIDILNNEIDSELALRQGGESSYSQGSSNILRKPFISTPIYSDGTPVGLRPNVVYPMNGYDKNYGYYNSKVPNPKSNLKNPQKQPKSKHRCYAPITNPRTDFEILLEMDDSDEPVSNTSIEERPSEFSRQTVSQVSMFDSTPMDGSSSIFKKKSFTANEVVRLREKKKYEGLLEKMMKHPLYVPVEKKTPLNEVDLAKPKAKYKREHTKPSFFTAKWLREADEDEKTTVSHLEIVELYEKYYKSCQLIPIPCSPQKQPPQRNEDTGLVAQRNEDAGLLAQRNEDAGLLAQRNEDAGLLAQRNKDAGPHSQPLPLYRPKAKYKREHTKPSFFTAEWLREAKKSIIEETEECMQRVGQEEHVIKRHQARREARFAAEQRRLNLCRIPGDLYPEPSSGKDEFLDLQSG